MPAERQAAQLPLNIQLRDEATFESFLGDEASAPLLRALQGQLQPDGEPVIFVHGPQGSGKSHLLQAACHLAGAGALYLPLAELAAEQPAELLLGLEQMQLVALDDLHCVAGRDDWETALFHCFNRARESGCRLLLAAQGAPRSLPVRLQDLASRLSWGEVYRLQANDEARRLEILRARSRQRGLQLPPEVASYIVNRAPRGLGDLLQVLERLDRASLVEKRPLTIPLVKRTLGW